MKEKIYIIFKNNEEEYDDYSDWIIEIYKDKEKAENRFVELVKTNQYKKDRAIKSAKYNEDIGAYRIEEHEIESEKRQDEVIDTNASSIEKDIHLLESYAGMTHKMTDNQGRPKLDQAIEHILSDYKRLQEENEKLREDNIDYKRILDLADNRTYRKKYLEERRKEQPDLLYPDADEIYRRYYELKKENKELKETYKSEKKMKNEYAKLYQDLLLKENVIPVQKVKDKIEALSKTKSDLATYIAVSERIRALQEILEESEDSKDGEG